MGIYCEGFEEQFKALLVAIEAGRSTALKSTIKKERELKQLICLINYDNKEVVLGGIGLRGGGLVHRMKTRILSWNVRRINDVNKHLRIRSLLRSSKIDIYVFKRLC